MTQQDFISGLRRELSDKLLDSEYCDVNAHASAENLPIDPLHIEVITKNAIVWILLSFDNDIIVVSDSNFNGSRQISIADPAFNTDWIVKQIEELR